MTYVLHPPDRGSQFHTSALLMRQVIATAACGVPAAALADRSLAEWVRAHGITVIARDDRDLDAVQYCGIRPRQAVFRCGPLVAPLRRAVHLGVVRYIVDTSQQMARLTEYGHGTMFIYLDDRAPLVLGDRHLKVFGLHCDVDDSGGAVEWASAAERLLCRCALLKTCGSSIRRISLRGGSTDIWLGSQEQRLTSIMRAVDGALRGACDRWHVQRPAVTLSPLTLGTPSSSAWGADAEDRRGRSPNCLQPISSSAARQHPLSTAGRAQSR